MKDTYSPCGLPRVEFLVRRFILYGCVSWRLVWFVFFFSVSFTFRFSRFASFSFSFRFIFGFVSFRYVPFHFRLVYASIRFRFVFPVWFSVCFVVSLRFVVGFVSVTFRVVSVSFSVHCIPFRAVYVFLFGTRPSDCDH